MHPEPEPCLKSYRKDQTYQSLKYVPPVMEDLPASLAVLGLWSPPGGVLWSGGCDVAAWQAGGG